MINTLAYFYTFGRDHRCGDSMLAGFTTTSAISAYQT